MPPIMTAEEKVFGILRNDRLVTALVPDTRIKVPGDWQGLARPYIIHQPAGAEPTNCYDGPKELRIWRFYQISVYADTYREAREIAAAVEYAMDGYVDENTDRISLARTPTSLGYDTDLKAMHIALDFEIAGALG